MSSITALPGMPLSPEHARLFDSLLATLTKEEALWICGYLAAFGSQPSPAGMPAGQAAGTPLYVLYGSETGHAENLAHQACERAQAAGLTACCVDLADFRPQDIRDVRHLLLLTSTSGDGDPPDNAAGFSEFLLGRKAPRLDNLQYAVLGLGDSSYARFCQTGKDFDRRLEELGGRRLHERADCDIDYEKPAMRWLDAALAAFRAAMAREMPVSVPSTATGVATAAMSAFNEKNPFPATILDRIQLNGRGSGKATWHVEFALADSGLAWEPGDALGVWPENDPALVAELIAHLGLHADDAVPDDIGEITLAEALARRREITTLTPGFLERYAEAANARGLRALFKAGREEQLAGYLAERQIIDVVGEFPLRGFPAGDFVAMLRPLQPRLYSLASSLSAFPGEAHLTVGLVRYTRHGRERRGVASAWLAERRLDETVPVYVSSNRKFHLPADPATPLIMIGPGTGVAPFRAFLQEREAVGAPGRNWLFFGDRHFRTDFLYQTEWQRWLRDGRLSRMDVAFSRDGAAKVYVQHRLREQAREIHAWLAEGACIYVCGDAAHMAPEVHATLRDIVAAQSNLSEERAEECLRQLQHDKRYRRDVY